MKRFARRSMLLGGGAILGGLTVGRCSSELPSLDGVTWIRSTAAERTLNDASGLSQTPIHKHIVLRQDPNLELINMAYGRLNVDRAHFFEQALMITYRPDPDQDDRPPVRGSGWMSHMARHVYRAQLGNEA